MTNPLSQPVANPLNVSTRHGSRQPIDVPNQAGEQLLGSNARIEELDDDEQPLERRDEDAKVAVAKPSMIHAPPTGAVLAMMRSSRIPTGREMLHRRMQIRRLARKHLQGNLAPLFNRCEATSLAHQPVVTLAAVLLAEASLNSFKLNCWKQGMRRLRFA